ncbi:hypothetical protein [Frigoriglobus tundricola]|uniref:Uncharacterized protein n=1 Tax=Frigoriglobus tundricola TaxID=2774151 RepID=A0A6M5YX82_9BACT|nr:hypothetical protein [Frigoriglobus tundricola]QJW98599.1 hypothetical protein FTUN_6194 [Frigoriglobus tundricola]
MTRSVRRTYRLSANALCHDVWFNRRGELVVEREAAPAPSEAESLLYRRAEALVAECGGEGCPIDSSDVQVATDAP